MRISKFGSHGFYIHWMLLSDCIDTPSHRVMYGIPEAEDVQMNNIIRNELQSPVEDIGDSLSVRDILGQFFHCN